MSDPASPQAGPSARDVEGWLAELGVTPAERADRERITAWDLMLDGERRFDVPATVILDPALAVIVWIHFAPPILDRFRVSYRRLLKWNDAFPFVKFALAEDERPVLSTEIPLALLDRDALGLAIVRLLSICDQLLEESAAWLWVGGRIPDTTSRIARHSDLFARYVDRLGDLRPS